LDALKFISQANYARHERRIGQELQVLVVVITFYLAVTWSAFALDAFPRGNPAVKVTVWVAFFVVGAAAYIYMRTSAQSNAINQHYYMEAERAIEQRLKDEGIVIQRHADPNPNRIHKVLTWLASPLVAFLENKKARSIRCQMRKKPSLMRWAWQTLVILAIGLLCGVVIAMGR